MRPVVRGNCPVDDNGDEIVFTEYSRARRYLIDNIGEYCSYCERKIEVNLAVEHILPKSINPAVLLDWNNFLLGCTNCNSTKGQKPVNLINFYWPDIDNTYSIFLYDHSGFVQVQPSLTSRADKAKAKRLIALVGLDKPAPNNGTVSWQEASDRRFEHRLKAFVDSRKNFDVYNSAKNEIRAILLPVIVSLVVHQGFWSIWMNAFEDFPEVQRALIDAHNGTNTNFFTHVP